jgi:hypothetical protein
VSSIQRQQALLVAEAWQNLYSNQSYVDFQSYTQDNLVNAILNYVQVNYPDNFNDWITNSEFVIKVRIFAWLHQNISYRTDLNVRENFVQTATRREAILMLAENVFYKPNRVTGASGELRVDSILTNQPIFDSNGDNISNIEINWNDPANPDWFEQFILIMNAALTPRTQFGHPLSRFTNTPTRTDLYMLNSRSPTSGVYPFSVQVISATLPFEFINVDMNKDTGVLSELPPNAQNAQRILYRSDGRGSGSVDTGFFLPIRQGTLVSFEQNFSTPKSMQSVILGTANCDNNTIFVQQIDSSGNVILDWTEVDTLYGEGTAFNTLDPNIKSIYETHTLLNDQVEVQFGDGKFGAIPTDRFRFFYRVVNPIPVAIQTTDIQKQSFVIPYVNNNTLYFLTIRASLVSPITNALPTDTNDSIKQAMGGVFAAQDRMVTAADYNLYPKKDPSILKVKAVNRTYSGHSAYSKIYDPTGFYSGIKILGEDGRLFRTDDRKSQFVSALTTQITLDELVLKYITPLIQQSDKTELYYNKYDEILTTGNPLWVNTSIYNGLSRGNVKKSNTVIPVGETSGDEFKYFLEGTIVRYNNLSGPLFTVDRIITDGTLSDSIILDKVIDDNTPIFSLMPPLRNQFNGSESSNIRNQLFNLQDFGIGWNQTEQEWVIISNSNLDKVSQFSLTYQGDTANIQRDASWLVYLRYIPNGNDGPEWEIVDRGMGVYFESARDVDFVYANTGILVDPNSGKLVRDNINILGINEARDSLHRLGLYQFGPCCPIIYDFTSDGITACYNIRQRVAPEDIFVFVDNLLYALNDDYTVSDTHIGEEICFVNVPIAGKSISIRLNTSYLKVVQSIVKVNADGITKFFPITGVQQVMTENTFLFLDGVGQGTGDYSATTQSLNAGFFVNPTVPSGVRVLGYALSGVSNNVIQLSEYVGDGITTLYSTNCKDQTINSVAVFLDGVFQTAGLDYTIDNITSPPYSFVSFVTAPAAGVTLEIHAIPFINFVRSATYTSIADGVSSHFSFVNFSGISPEKIIVGVDGIVQREGDDYTITSNGITFLFVPLSGQRINIFIIYSALGFSFLDSNASCNTSFLLEDKIWDVVDFELTPDGYTEVNGVKVNPDDSNFDGQVDNPYEFDDIVIPDGVTDLVLWRSIIKDGFSVWDPIDETTVPKATYGYQTKTGIIPNTIFDQSQRTANDIHFDQTTKLWLIADSNTGNWIVAPKQSDYMSAIGRSGLKFIWTHYPADNTRIDPSISNIIDFYVLPVSYDNLYRIWISSGFSGNKPEAPTTESLQNAYGYLNDKRMTDDELIFHPINYKPLFGSVAEEKLQAKFLAIKTPGSTLSDNDLILRIINAIDIFFDASNWDLGESFYLTELIAFIHRMVAPNLQSIVMVSKEGDPFGSLFQIRSAPDELFISVAQPSDVQIVSSFNNDNLQIGTL